MVMTDMNSIWFFIPKSGVIFIFVSVFFIFLWNTFRYDIDDSFAVLIAMEIALFFVCLYGANKESQKKL